jgi:K+-transporting ATPase KdpF subunit
MSALDVISLITAIGLLILLIRAMLQPERF